MGGERIKIIIVRELFIIIGILLLVFMILYFSSDMHNRSLHFENKRDGDISYFKQIAYKEKKWKDMANVNFESLSDERLASMLQLNREDDPLTQEVNIALNRIAAAEGERRRYINRKHTLESMVIYLLIFGYPCYWILRFIFWIIRMLRSGGGDEYYFRR